MREKTGLALKFGFKFLVGGGVPVIFISMVFAILGPILEPCIKGLTTV